MLFVITFDTIITTIKYDILCMYMYVRAHTHSEWYLMAHGDKCMNHGVYNSQISQLIRYLVYRWVL